MDRIAILVDAGYFYAQGSRVVWGSRQPRNSLRLRDLSAFIEALGAEASRISGIPSLLRIYWYDAVRGGPDNLSGEQSLLAAADNVKMRLGSVNQFNRQKGVDSQIIIDLIDLARNGAISDALLVSGDEDLRVGVEVAQSLGIRIHLLGIGENSAQSLTLQQAADTTDKWGRETISEFLQMTGEPVVEADVERPQPYDGADTELEPVVEADVERVRPYGGADAELEAVARDYIINLDQVEAARVSAVMRHALGVPSEHDRELLSASRTALGRDLDGREKRRLRAKFRELAARNRA